MAVDLDSLSRRLARGTQDARRIADNAEILAARLQREFPKPSAGLAYAVNEHAELSDVLADAHAVVVRLAAYPEILQVLSALENGAEVVVRTDESHASPSRAAGNRSARTDAVGGEHNPTSHFPKFVSGLIKAVAGHRNSSTSAHLSAPASAMTDHRTGDFQSAGKAFQRSGNGRAR